MNLDTLLIISNIESANTILVTTCFRTWMFNLPVTFFVYFFLLSRWKRIAKTNFEKMNAIITVNAEVEKIVGGISSGVICNDKADDKTDYPWN